LNIAYPIFINTNVVDAEIYIDGSFKGRTDSNYTLTVKDIQPGKHTLKIQHGTDIAEQDIEVTSDNLAFRIEVNTTTSRAQYVVFQVVPSNAIVSINKKKYTPDRNGVVTTTLQNGTYNYQVRADEYHSESGTFTVRGEKIIKPVELKPAYGWLTVADNSVVNGANIYVDNKHIGKAPITRSKIAGGTHHIMVVKDMYHTLEESITIRDNEELKYTPTLSADFATVTFDAGTGCDIYINDDRKGTSPWTGNLATGTYIIEARKEGHRSTTISQNITATPSKQKYTLDAPMPIFGTINIVSTPALAKVYIDGQLVGETPLMKDILACSHEISVKMSSYRTERQNITISENEITDLTFTLKKEYAYNSQTPSYEDKTKSPLVTLGVEVSSEGITDYGRADLSPLLGYGLSMRIGRTNSLINGSIGVKYLSMKHAEYSLSYSYWIGNNYIYSSADYERKVKQLVFPLIVKCNFGEEWFAGYFGVGYEFGILQSDSCKFTQNYGDTFSVSDFFTYGDKKLFELSVPSRRIILQTGFAGRHYDWVLVYFKFNTNANKTKNIFEAEKMSFGTSLTYYF
jgi:hypothetical protein